MFIKNYKKSIATLILCSMAIASAMSPSVSAANYEDTSLPTSFISYTSNAATAARSKDDSSSVYIKNTSGMTLWVYANGGNKPDNPGAAYSTGTTINTRAKVPEGKYLIRSTVYESGYRKAWLNISTAVAGVSGNCRGKWSPDSINSYPKVN